MNARLAGKRCLVTGGGSGIGRAVALRFAAEGAAVVVELAADGDLLVGRLRRNGIGVLTATMPYKQERAAAADLDALCFRNINLKRTAQAPVHLLPVLEVEEAFHWRVDFTLTYGRVFEDLA